MKKILMMFLSLVLFCGCTLHKKPQTTSPLEILTLFQSQSKAQNKLWIGTMQLAFNDFKEYVVKKDIYFANEIPSADLIGLNQGLFNKSMLSEKSYYTSYGETSIEAKNEIKKDLKKKFDTTSDLIDGLDWTKGAGKYYAYAMLKKEFEFYFSFDKLKKSPFNKSKEKYTYFGVDKKTKKSVKDSVRVLFYNNSNDYAVQLHTKTNDQVYLYRTESDKDFEKIYKKMVQESNDFSGNRELGDKDTLKVPNLKIKEIKKYQELCNKTIVGTNIFFSEAIETIDLLLNEKGGKVKSEAILMTKNTSLPIIDPNDKPREFNFDKTYVMFLVDEGRENPYFAIRIKDLKGLQ